MIISFNYSPSPQTPLHSMWCKSGPGVAPVPGPCIVHSVRFEPMATEFERVILVTGGAGFM